MAEQLVGQVVFVGLSELQPAYLAVAGVIAALAVEVQGSAAADPPREDVPPRRGDLRL